MLKNISIQKRSTVKTDKHPTHDLVACDEDYKNKVMVGSLWTKVAQDAEGKDYKFLSGVLQKEKDKYEGYVIITEREYRQLKGEVKAELGEVKVDDIPF